MSHFEVYKHAYLFYCNISVNILERQSTDLIQYNPFESMLILMRAVAGQRSSPDLCFATKPINLSKSMTRDLDLKVTQGGS